MRIIITGATGMVGSEVLTQALTNSAIKSVTALVRKPLNILHPKLKIVIHKDFLNYEGLERVFRDNDACVWCLGISQTQVTEQEYIVVTHDYTLAAGKAMLAANADIKMLFLSGNGASSSEQSRLLFGRVKGKAENALLALPFSRINIARPGGILPVNNIDTSSVGARIKHQLIRFMKLVMPARVIPSTDLARAMLHVVLYGAPDTILDYKELAAIAKEIKA